MAISQRFCLALVVVCPALVFVCLGDEANKKNDDVKTIRGKDVSARIHGRSGKIQIVRKDDDNGGTEDRGKDSGDGPDNKDSVDKKDDSDKDIPDKDSKDRKGGKDNGKDDRDDGKDKTNDGKDKKNDDKDDKNNDKDDDGDDDDFKDDNKDLLSFELDELKEKDADGNDVDDKHSVDSFDDVIFQITPVGKRSKFQGLSVLNVNLSSSNLDGPKAKLGLIVYLFLEAGTVRFGNETFAVQSGTVKFNIRISDWDFCEDSSPDCDKGKAGEYLDLSLNIKSRSSPTEVDDDDRKKVNKPAVCLDDDKDDDKDDQDDKDDDDDDDDDCPIIYDMGGDSEMLLNRGIMTDDTDYTPMPAGFPKIETDDGKKKVVFRIPKFSKTALVDPSVTPGKRNRKNAASWMQVNFTFALLLQVAVMFAAH